MFDSADDARKSNIDSFQSEVNLNGTAFVRAGGIDSEESSTTRVLDKLTALLSKGIDLGDGDFFRLESGSMFADNGHVTTGQLAFNVGHDEHLATSYADIDIVPEAGAFGDGRIFCSLRAYVSKTAVYVTAQHKGSMQDVTLARFAIVHGNLHSLFMDVDSELTEGQLIPVNAIPHQGFVKVLN